MRLAAQQHTIRSRIAYNIWKYSIYVSIYTNPSIFQNQRTKQRKGYVHPSSHHQSIQITAPIMHNQSAPHKFTAFFVSHTKFMAVQLYWYQYE